MRLSARKIAVFSAQFVVLFAGFLLIYPALLPAYNSIALALANAVLSQLPLPMYVRAAPDNSWQIYRLPSQKLYFTLEADYLNLVYLNLALLPALLLATPIPYRQRLKLWGWGMLILVGVHALSVVAIVRSEVCVHYDPDNLGCNVVEGLFGIGGQLFAVAIWGLLTWRYWFPQRSSYVATKP
jgi:hypothetical protein